MVKKNIQFAKYIESNPKICGGEVIIKGTRVTLRTVLASLAEGASVASIIKDFPSLTEDAITAVIAFAAKSAEEDMPVAILPDIS